MKTELAHRDVICAEAGPLLCFTSVDVAAGIGSLSNDNVLADPADVAYFVCRAAVTELVSLNVSVRIIAVATSFPHDKRQPVDVGVSELLSSVGANPRILFSHENYIRVPHTTIAVTAIGWERPRKIVCRRLLPGMAVYAYGPGYLRPDIRRTDGDLPDLALLRRYIDANNDVRQIIPVGSRGIRHDIHVLGESTGLRFEGSTKGCSLRGGPGLQFLILASTPPPLSECRRLGVFVSD